MNIENLERHAATLDAAEKFVDWLKEAGEHDVMDVVSVLWDVVAAAGIGSLGPAIAFDDQRRVVSFDLAKDLAT